MQRRFYDASNARCHLILEVENFFHRTVETIGPNMRAAERVDQLGGDAHPTAGFANRAFEHVAHTQFTPDLLKINCLPLVGEARIAGDDEEPADERERGNYLFDHTVREIFLFRVTAHIGERQYGY